MENQGKKVGKVTKVNLVTFSWPDEASALWPPGTLGSALAITDRVADTKLNPGQGKWPWGEQYYVYEAVFRACLWWQKPTFIHHYHILCSPHVLVTGTDHRMSRRNGEITGVGAGRARSEPPSRGVCAPTRMWHPLWLSAQRLPTAWGSARW